MITMDNKYQSFDLQKQFGKENQRLQEEAQTQSGHHDTYGTYDITGEISDYTTVEDNNENYGQ